MGFTEKTRGFGKRIERRLFTADNGTPRQLEIGAKSEFVLVFIIKLQRSGPRLEQRLALLHGCGAGSNAEVRQGLHYPDGFLADGDYLADETNDIFGVVLTVWIVGDAAALVG